MTRPELTSPNVALLFWNVQGKDVKHSIVRMVQGHGVNVLVMAEAEKQDSDALLTAINEQPGLPGESVFRLLVPEKKAHPQSAMSDMRVFTRFPLDVWALHVIHNRYAVWTVSVPGRRQFILATVHFPAIQQEQGDKQREIAVALRRDIEEAELEASDKEPLVVVIGDFNANPFDAGIAAVYGLNATHLEDIAAIGFRTGNGRPHPCFYNPMWRFLGVEPWGTYFNDKLTNPVRFDWFVFDQVLVRPNVIPFFHLNGKDAPGKPDLQILTSDGIVDFNLAAKRTKRESEAFSDHLPLYFRFSLPAQTEV